MSDRPAPDSTPVGDSRAVYGRHGRENEVPGEPTRTPGSAGAAPSLSLGKPGLSSAAFRQTVSFLIQRFQDAGLRPRTAHGQNFLVDLNLLELLAQAAAVGPEDVVLEVGTGTGALTALVAPYAAAVVTVEIDRHLYQLAREQLLDFPNVVMLQQDALKNKNRFEARLLATLREQLQAGAGRRLKLVANLPYNIATPVISNLLTLEFVPVSMTVTIQKELAERITARPGCKDYSALSVWVQSQCDTAVLRFLPPTVFWPRPKVESAIIQIVPQAEKRGRIADRAFFHGFVRAMFFHRRKFLRSELYSAVRQHLGKADVDAILAEQGLVPTCRAEQLEVTQLIALGAAVQQRLAGVRAPGGWAAGGGTDRES